MKTKTVFMSIFCLGLCSGLMAQLPGINKDKIKMSKIKKGESESEKNSSTTESTNEAKTTNPSDDEAMTKMAYYFNDKNGELSALYSLYNNNYSQTGYFCRQVLKLNPQEVKNNIAECEKKWPDTYNENFWVVNELKPRFDSYSGDMIEKQKENFEKYIKQCDEFIVSGNYVKALVVAKYTDSLALSMFAFQPENTTVKEMKAKTDEKINSITDKLSAYHSSPFHTKNTGKILFSKNEIVVGQENESAMAVSFSESDKIYAMVYLDGRIKDYDDKMLHLRIQQEGLNYAITMEYPVTKENENQSYIMIPVLCSVTENKSDAGYEVVRMLSENAKPGETKITATVLNNSQRLQMEQGELYKAQFTLNVTDGSALKGLFEEYYKAKVAAARIPAPVVKNTQLEADAKKVSTQLFIGNVTPLRISLQENWNIEYDYYGTPSFRYLRAFVAIKDNNTGKCHYQMMKIGQDYAGAGNYGSTYLYDPAAPYDLNEIECGNVNK